MGGTPRRRYKALHDATVAYLVDDCQLVSHAGRRWLRSADIDTCCVPRTNTRLGGRNFAAAGPRLWNSLPARFASPITTSENFVGSWNRFCLIDTAAHSDYCSYAPYSYSLPHSLTIGAGETIFYHLAKVQGRGVKIYCLYITRMWQSILYMLPNDVFNVLTD